MANDGGILATGTVGSGASLTTAGGGTRMIWYPKKSALRAGTVSGTQWNDATIGNYSTAFGRSTTASGQDSLAMGFETTASNTAATALGYQTYASGLASTALGWGSSASGAESIAGGYYSTASGLHSMAFGDYASSIGNYSTAFGYYTAANSYAQTTIGRHNMPTGSESATTWVATDPLFVVGNGTGTGANRANALTILKNGNVGVGTTSPNDKVDVQGSIRVSTGDVGYAGQLTYSYGPQLSMTTPAEEIEDNMQFVINGASADTTGNAFIWKTQTGGAAPSEKMRISKDGNVGIGTTAPAAQLDVNGRIVASAITIAGGALSAGTGSGMTIPGAGLTQGLVYYMSASGLSPANASAVASMPGVCIASTATACIYSGTFKFAASPGWTIGGVLYVATSAGGLTQTAPSGSGEQVQRVGVAIASDTILIMPSLDVGGVQ
ncbi:MAG: hypothetical protein A2X94_00200 [Bdellovibrionales bacterium GWB1_55_8]|nr:MAG: hypothetical protein A2X94_00200 [Bdellovibrionales bacterium GWB1_55_8]